MHSVNGRNKSKSVIVRRSGITRLLRSKHGVPAKSYFLWMHGVLLAFWFFTSGTLATAQVHVWEGTLKLPVYEEGAPDPTPAFDQSAVNRFNYPYTLRTEITNNRVEHDLRAIYLENEYLKCSVLPDIGGHIYTCVDKINGLAMFYANPSLKKANIGYRGAWAAFGVEFNFPVSHNWVSMSPVDFAYGASADGSASITVSNIDRVYGMQWTVELTLRPESTVLEQHVTLNNRSDVRHRFYWWNNAGVQAWDNSQIEYPMRFAAAHGFAEVQTWPVDSQGKDLSIIKNQTDGPVSLFAYGSRENFMGVWHPKTNSGTVHFADYTELPAKKIWSWGVDADGLDWRTALSDDNSAYVEVQAGLFRNQETYAFLEPRQTINFTEYWMPAREVGGITRANLAGVLHLARKDGTLSVALNANRKIHNASLRIVDGASSLFDAREDLSPEQTWKKEFHFPDASRKYRFELRDHDGAILLTQTAGEYDWTPASEIKIGPQTNYAMPEEKNRTADDWLQFGKNAELNGELLIAAESYQKALERFPSGFELHKAAGRLLASLQRFDDALPHLTFAHDRDTTDSETSYYLGISYEGLARDREAADGYAEAMRLPNYRAAAALRLAELRAREGQVQEAENLLKTALAFDSLDLRTAEELSAVMRANKEIESANKLANEWIVRSPTSNFLREEIGKAPLQHLAADPYRVLAIASEYARLGLYQRALEVLSRKYQAVPADRSEPGAVLPQNNPLVVYFRGYCREKLGTSGASDYREASRLSTLYVFPNIAEDFSSLTAALRNNENDATAHFLLGEWYFSRGQSEPSLKEWERARALNPTLPVLDASLGLALLSVERNFDGAFKVFEEGIKNDPLNITNYSGAVVASSLLGRSPTERVKTLERYPNPGSMPTALVYELALGRAEAADYDGATRLFQNRFFGREEGGTNVRQVWIEVKLAETIGLGRAGRCQDALAVVKSLASPVAGLAFTKDGLNEIAESARTNYLLGDLFAVCGQKAEAEKRYQLAAQSPDSQQEPSQVVWQWAAARKLNGYDPALWHERLTATLSKVESNLHADASGWLFFAKGVLLVALGRQEDGELSLRQALLLPQTHMSHHFVRLALDGATPRYL
jgi:tetratricopeptide (TPR) repeat protein